MANFIDYTYISGQDNGLNPGLTNETGEVNHNIERVMIDDMKSLLGERLYWELVNDPSHNGAKGNYVKLLDGGTYTYDGLTSWGFSGVKYITYLFWMARYRYYSKDIDTTWGYSEFKGDNTFKTKEDRDKEVADRIRASAFKEWEDTYTYLQRNSDDYTEWRGSDARMHEGYGHVIINKLKIQ